MKEEQKEHFNNFRSHHQRFFIHKNLSLSIFYCAITNTIIDGFFMKGNWTLGENCNCVICDIFLAFYVFICQIHMRKKGDNKNVEQGWDTHVCCKNRLKSNQHYLEEIKLNWHNKSCGSKTKCCDEMEKLCLN